MGCNIFHPYKDIVMFYKPTNVLLEKFRKFSLLEYFQLLCKRTFYFKTNSCKLLYILVTINPFGFGFCIILVTIIIIIISLNFGTSQSFFKTSYFFPSQWIFLFVSSGQTSFHFPLFTISDFKIHNNLVSIGSFLENIWI